MRAPTEEELNHDIWKCFACNSTLCKVCSPPPYRLDEYYSCQAGEQKPERFVHGEYPECSLGRCTCRFTRKYKQIVFSCSPKCKSYTEKYCANPYGFHKQCFRLQIQRMLNNFWEFTQWNKSSMMRSEHSYKDLTYQE